MIYLLVGTPGSGKSWIAERLKGRVKHVAHDDYQRGGYVEALIKAARTSSQPVLGETPFSVSQLVEPIERAGIKVQPIFVIESETTTSARYQRREGKAIPQGHLTRIATYRKRAKEMSAPSGTSTEMLKYLEGVL